tara:strand:+ start:185 stop:382 length:198 start_codon:yes stop_codon:yes gene_type:complete
MRRDALELQRQKTIKEKEESDEDGFDTDSSQYTSDEDKVDVENKRLAKAVVNKYNENLAPLYYNE